ncbi:MAG: hypothetical protein ABW252_05255 [Polyangiales bacterium]
MHDSGAPLSARIVARRPLLYREGAEPKLDRPAHVRAASGIAWVGQRLAVVQDDAHFVALVDPTTGVADAIALPAGADGKRVFDEARGTKHLKLDLEAVFSFEDGDGTHLIALGSGSLPARERIVTARFADADGPVSALRVQDAISLYGGLRAAVAFSGSELNLEGALVRGDQVLLFQRGNGAPARGVSPQSAVGKLELSALKRYLAGDGPAPTLVESRVYNLGSASGVPYGFTDATLRPDGAILFLASAEASADVTRDGAVFGTLVGLLRDDGGVRTTPLLDEAGEPTDAKAEGIALHPRDPSRAYLVVDPDAAEQPATLLEVVLTAI